MGLKLAVAVLLQPCDAHGIDGRRLLLAFRRTEHLPQASLLLSIGFSLVLMKISNHVLGEDGGHGAIRQREMSSGLNMLAYFCVRYNWVAQPVLLAYEPRNSTANPWILDLQLTPDLELLLHPEPTAPPVL